MSDTAQNVSTTEAAVDALNLKEADDFVDPWNVESQSDTGIDYDKLISESFNWVTFFNGFSRETSLFLCRFRAIW